MSKILLVVEDIELANSIFAWCKSEMQDVERVRDVQEAIDLIASVPYDALILDFELRGFTGLELCRKLRAEGNAAPIVLLAGDGDEELKIIGLDAGADEVLVKPLKLKELSARLRSLIRRASGVGRSTFRLHDIELDPVGHKVVKGGSSVQLMPKEFTLLEFLLRHRNQIFSAEALLSRIWHTDCESSIEAVRACIKRLRSKIDGDADEEHSIIETVPKIGYRLRNTAQVRRKKTPQERIDS